MLTNVYYVVVTHGKRADGSEYDNARVEWIDAQGTYPLPVRPSGSCESYKYYFFDTRRRAVERETMLNSQYKSFGTYGFD